MSQQEQSSVAHEPGERRVGLLARWHRAPLYLRIVGALLLGAAAGTAMWLGAESGAPWAMEYVPAVTGGLGVVARLLLRLLSALAPPLILIAVVHALLGANVRGRTGVRLVGLLVLNTLVAIGIGLLVANVLRPGDHAALEGQAAPARTAPADPWQHLLENIPTSVVKPLVDNQVIGVIFIAVAFGIALRRVREQQIRHGKTGYRNLEEIIETAFACLIVVLHWIVDIIPIGVFAVVASIVGREGFVKFQALGWFVVAVIAALLLQACYYLTRVRLGSWVRPLHLLRGTRDALVMAFSTASSTATMPVTYSCLRDRVGLREESASMGALVGANFNNDGTALYEAMSALFVSQMLAQHLDLQQQLLVVLTSVVASVGAAGIPEAGLVTMTLVFNAVHLPTEYIAYLLTVDWFLDRCRTAINVMGDLNVSCLLDGKVRAVEATRGE